MKKLENLFNDNAVVNSLHTIKGGTSTTYYQEVGYVAETEYKDQDKDGKKDDPNDEGILVDFPI